VTPTCAINQLKALIVGAPEELLAELRGRSAGGQVASCAALRDRPAKLLAPDDWSEAAFAALAGVSPIPASCGQVTRHRLNRGGDRRLNRALHTTALVRLRDDPETRAYARRRRAEGKSPEKCGAPCQRGKLLAFTLEGFVVPVGYVGAPGMQPLGALGIYAATTAEAASRTPLRCLNERRTATPTVHNTQAVLATCHDAQEPAAVLLRWSQQGTFVLLNVLGSSQVNQRLIIVLADHLRLVPPRS
jgi:Transposase IS116/IS110/IS902 family